MHHAAVAVRISGRQPTSPEGGGRGAGADSERGGHRRVSPVGQATRHRAARGGPLSTPSRRVPRSRCHPLALRAPSTCAAMAGARARPRRGAPGRRRGAASTIGARSRRAAEPVRTPPARRDTRLRSHPGAPGWSRSTTSPGRTTGATARPRPPGGSGFGSPTSSPLQASRRTTVRRGTGGRRVRRPRRQPRPRPRPRPSPTRRRSRYQGPPPGHSAGLGDGAASPCPPARGPAARRVPGWIGARSVNWLQRVIVEAASWSGTFPGRRLPGSAGRRRPGHGRTRRRDDPDVGTLGVVGLAGGGTGGARLRHRDGPGLGLQWPRSSRSRPRSCGQVRRPDHSRPPRTPYSAFAPWTADFTTRPAPIGRPIRFPARPPGPGRGRAGQQPPVSAFVAARGVHRVW